MHRAVDSRASASSTPYGPAANRDAVQAQRAAAAARAEAQAADQVAAEAQAAARIFMGSRAEDPFVDRAAEAEKEAAWKWEQSWGAPPICLACETPVVMTVSMTLCKPSTA